VVTTAAKTYKAPVKSSPTNQHPTFYRLDALLSLKEQCQKGNCTSERYKNIGLAIARSWI